jgi:hypothetical protein
MRRKTEQTIYQAAAACPMLPCLHHNVDGAGCQGRRNRDVCGVYPWLPELAVLAGHPPSEKRRQLGVDDAPITPPSCPFPGNTHHRQIQHFQQTVVGRKDGFDSISHLKEKHLSYYGRCGNIIL